MESIYAYNVNKDVNNAHQQLILAFYVKKVYKLPQMGNVFLFQILAYLNNILMFYKIYVSLVILHA